MGKGDNYRPVNKERYDFNYLKIFGYCQDFLCPKNHCCFRYQERIGKNNINYIPKQDDYSACPFFSPAICYYCSGKGYFDDWCKIQKKQIKTVCLICGGGGKLYPKDNK